MHAADALPLAHPVHGLQSCSTGCSAEDADACLPCPASPPRPLVSPPPRLPSTTAAHQVYKALRHGVQPVAVKVLSTSSDMRQARCAALRCAAPCCAGLRTVALLRRIASARPCRAWHPYAAGRQPAGRRQLRLSSRLPGCSPLPGPPFTGCFLTTPPQLALADFRREIAILKVRCFFHPIFYHF